jgi:hypothetical protein
MASVKNVDTDRAGRSRRAGKRLVNDRDGWHNDRPRRHRDEAVAPIAAGSGS